jgi:replicative DNA helicase
MAEIIIAKNRMGQSGFVQCKFEGDYSKFSDTELDIY